VKFSYDYEHSFSRQSARSTTLADELTENRNVDLLKRFRPYDSLKLWSCT